MSEKELFVSFEGVEGCGKSTQIFLLADYLLDNNIPHVVSREPGGSKTGRKIRDILLDTTNTNLNSTAELLLYAADRSQHLSEVINPAIAEGNVVLCDRYIDATSAYQGYGRQLDSDLVDQLNAIASNGLKPDITFLITCPVEVGLTRALRRSKLESANAMRFENEDLSFHKRVMEGYEQALEDEPERIVEIAGVRPIKDVHQNIIDVLMDKFGDRIGLD